METGGGRNKTMLIECGKHLNIALSHTVALCITEKHIRCTSGRTVDLTITYLLLSIVFVFVVVVPGEY